MLYVANSFSLGMLEEKETKLEAKPISLEEAKNILLTQEFHSVIGHEATASVLSKILGIYVPFNREAIKLKSEDQLIVFQLKFRLPEGAILTEKDLLSIKENQLFSLWLVETKEVI